MQRRMTCRLSNEIRGQVVEYAVASLIFDLSLSNALDMVERRDSDLESHLRRRAKIPRTEIPGGLIFYESGLIEKRRDNTLSHP
jgi:hypothetical protein